MCGGTLPSKLLSFHNVIGTVIHFKLYSINKSCFVKSIICLGTVAERSSLLARQWGGISGGQMIIGVGAKKCAKSFCGLWTCRPNLFGADCGHQCLRKSGCSGDQVLFADKRMEN